METLKRILLVDDDLCDIELTLVALKEYHLANEIAIAHDGIEALEYLHYQGAFTARPIGNPAVILLDLKMPRMDGIEVLKRLKSDEQTRSIPVVILTSSRETQELEKCYRLGANAYVVKPVLFTEFLKAVKEIGMFWALVNEPPPA